jgi:hypothetical protein
MAHALRLSSLVLAALLSLTACGSEEESASDEPTAAESSASEPTASASAEASAGAEPTKRPGTTIDVTFSGDTVDPAGVQTKVKAGEPINFHIVSDRPGELHVHSSPEQEIAYRAGTTRKTITIDQPGLVDVESHDPDKLVVKLEVR